MVPENRKEAYRRFWMVKGHLACDNWTDQDIKKMHDSYIYRLWYNHEANIHSDGFEEAWEKLSNDKQ